MKPRNQLISNHVLQWTDKNLVSANTGRFFYKSDCTNNQITLVPELQTIIEDDARLFFKAFEQGYKDKKLEENIKECLQEIASQFEIDDLVVNLLKKDKAWEKSSFEEIYEDILKAYFSGLHACIFEQAKLKQDF